MNNEELNNEQIDYPFIVFKIDKGLYCVNSKNISTILQVPPYQEFPDSPPNITGLFSYRGEVVEMYDVRSAFGIPTLRQEYESFTQMIDARKQDHINWVNELERCFRAGEKFTLATDPHKCAFGKWYDSYKFESDAAEHHMKQIEEPHRLLHEAAQTAGNCAQECSACTRDECLQKAVARIKAESMPTILRLLDETKEIFRATVYNEMVLLLSDIRVGLVVDEVISVESLAQNDDQSAINTFATSALVSNIKNSAETSALILELNLAGIFKDVM